MVSKAHTARPFSERYGQLRTRSAAMARERPEDISEHVVQCIWYDQLLKEDALRIEGNRPIKVISPGWWNQGEGPDFKGAQIAFGDSIRNGDVEIHLDHKGWTHHGHHLDERYNDVILHVVLTSEHPETAPRTAAGRPIATLPLLACVDGDLREVAGELAGDDYPYKVAGTLGHCSAVVEAYGHDDLSGLVELAGEWRMLFKARTIRQRMDAAGPEQALYEAFFSACGYSHFKHHFRVIARQFPYERAIQLARRDGLLLETALIQIAGLLPDELPEGTTAAPHYGRIRALRRDHLSGLKSLPLDWKSTGVRPNNRPERRLAGAARFIARAAKTGLIETLDEVWRAELSTLERRRKFEDLFPKAMGFWAEHCTWTGKRMKKPSAPLGSGRVRSIIGNVFVPAGLAIARMNRDRLLEETVFTFFAALPREPENKIVKVMIPRLYGTGKKPAQNFRTQQGLLQMYQDWCEPNPSCRNCRVLNYLNPQGKGPPLPGESSG